MKSDTAIVWLRRDLRLADNPALAAACERAERVLLVYIHAPAEDGRWRPGAASDWWLNESLAALEQSVAALGGTLCLRRGGTLEELLRLAREADATQVYWNRLYEPETQKRDSRVKVALRDAGLMVESFNSALLVEPWELTTSQGSPYRVFTPFWKECRRRCEELPPPLPAPARLRGPDPAPGSLTLEALGLRPTVPWDGGLRDAWRPGEAGALARLESFCTESLAAYPEGRNRPDRRDSSRLSPCLHFGEIGPRQCLTALRVATTEAPGTGKGAEEFLRELGWREFAYHLLQHYPETPEAPLNPRFAGFPWRPDQAHLHAWQRGKTGIPFVDAGMRELWTTGWMHNRVRMIVASFLTKNLLQPWTDGARWFWDTLVDADLANNTLGWQWTAGCGADAAPYFRVFNPVLQAERHDPDRNYIRRWVPEIAALPDQYVHRPWEAPEPLLRASGVSLGRTYPHPIVDLARSRQDALDAYQVIRSSQ